MVDINDDLRRQVEASAETIRGLAIIAAGDSPSHEWLDDHGLSITDDIGDALNTTVLEVVRLRGNDDLDGVELLLGYGGPTVRATARHNGDIRIDGYWGGDKYTAERMIYAPELVEWLWEVFSYE